MNVERAPGTNAVVEETFSSWGEEREDATTARTTEEEARG